MITQSPSVLHTIIATFMVAQGLDGISQCQNQPLSIAGEKINYLIYLKNYKYLYQRNWKLMSAEIFRDHIFVNFTLFVCSLHCLVQFKCYSTNHEILVGTFLFQAAFLNMRQRISLFMTLLVNPNTGSCHVKSMIHSHSPSLTETMEIWDTSIIIIDTLTMVTSSLSRYVGSNPLYLLAFCVTYLFIWSWLQFWSSFGQIKVLSSYLIGFTNKYWIDLLSHFICILL